MGNQICMRPLTYVTDGVGIIRLIWPGNISMQNKGSKLPVREAGKGRMHVHVSTNKRQGSRMVVSIINTGDDLIKIKESSNIILSTIFNQRNDCIVNERLPT